MTPEQIEIERAAFEADYLRRFGKPGYLGRDPRGTYEHLVTRSQWNGWLARAEQAQRVREALEAMLAVHDAPQAYRCPYCSFRPTSGNDFCDAHRPGRKAEVIAAARAALKEQS